MAAVLNSKVVLYFFSQISSSVRGGFLRWKRQYLEQIPIPSIPTAEQAALETLVTQILAAKKAAPTADTALLEGEIDRLVYGLYGLTEAEVRVVEGVG